MIIIDEAQEMNVEEQEAMLPVISAASDVSDAQTMPQQIFVGTPPGPACHGTVFRDMHTAAHSEEPGNVWWLEWSIDTVEPEKVIVDAQSALAAAYETNPAMGFRIAEKTILNEYETMTIAGFCRERLGWWIPIKSEQVAYAIPASVWDACASSEMKPEGKTAYGVKFSPDGAMVCLCGAVIPERGAARISLIEYKTTSHGMQWLADWLVERYKKASCVVIDGRNGVDVLIDKIADTWRIKGSIVCPSVKEVIAAVGMLTDALNEQAVTWYDKQEALRNSAVTSTKRAIGKASGWAFGGDESLPIEACALAYYGAKTSKRNPNKSMKIGC